MPGPGLFHVRSTQVRRPNLQFPTVPAPLFRLSAGWQNRPHDRCTRYGSSSQGNRILIGAWHLGTGRSSKSRNSSSEMEAHVHGRIAVKHARVRECRGRPAGRQSSLHGTRWSGSGPAATVAAWGSRLGRGGLPRSFISPTAGQAHDKGLHPIPIDPDASLATPGSGSSDLLSL